MTDLIDKYLGESYPADLAYSNWQPSDEKQMIKLYLKYKDSDKFRDEAFKLVGKYFKDPDDVETAIDRWISEYQAMKQRGKGPKSWGGALARTHRR